MANEHLGSPGSKAGFLPRWRTGSSFQNVPAVWRLSGLSPQKYENISERASVAGGSHLTCFGVGGAARVYYLDVNNQVNQLGWDSGSWHNEPLPGQAAAGSALTCFWVDGKVPHVYYLDVNNYVNELTSEKNSWIHNDVVDAIKPIKASPTKGARGSVCRISLQEKSSTK